MLRVLVVDDDRDGADTQAVLLRLWGHATAVAYDGPAALQSALAQTPDLLLLDLRLAGMDGLEVARRVRAEAALAGVVIWAVTGMTQGDAWRQATEAGCDRFLLKPVDPDEMRGLLSALGRPPG
jgi:CheY-like chemotaxis protein